MKSRLIGGLLLVVGTSIGGGMLALPIANAAMGFWQSSLFLVLCWFIMTCGALLLLEVTLYFPPGSNMLTMAHKTLGAPGLILAWLSYLFLLYTLLCGYISGGADVFASVAHYMHIILQPWQASTLFTVAFGAVVYGGISRVDWANRILMFGKLGIYILLIGLILPQTQAKNWQGGDYRIISEVIMLMVTAFGFAIIIPSLRVYFEDNIKALHQIVMIGSLIPLVCYILWNAVIIGSLPSHGTDGLTSLMHNPRPTSSLALLLANTLHNPIITSFFNSFTSICMLTAFLGVALCLVSFFADALKKETSAKEGFELLLIALLPPLGIVLFFPGAYMQALRYAGIFCVILLLLLPACMVLMGRKKYVAAYTAPGKRFIPYAVIIISCFLLLNEGIHLAL